MPEFDLRAFEDTLVLHFGTEGHRINAYTLASTLINIADAAKAANSEINPGYDVEVLVEALGQGSFKATIRALYRGTGNLFSADNLKALVIGVMAAYVYQHTLAPDVEVNIHVNSDEVVIEQGDDRIIVPRQVHDATQALTNNKNFVGSLGKAMECIVNDDNIGSFGFSASTDEPEPIRSIPKDKLAPLYREPLEDLPDVREIIVSAKLQIVRAILQRSNRRWEFVWNGITISAPVTDQEFYDSFFARKILIAPGDSLDVSLKIRQRHDDEIDIYRNEAYEVVKVAGHLPRGPIGIQLSEIE